jgi:hypothetical protein
MIARARRTRALRRRITFRSEPNARAAALTCADLTVTVVPERKYASVTTTTSQRNLYPYAVVQYVRRRNQKTEDTCTVSASFVIIYLCKEQRHARQLMVELWANDVRVKGDNKHKAPVHHFRDRGLRKERTHGWFDRVIRCDGELEDIKVFVFERERVKTHLILRLWHVVDIRLNRLQCGTWIFDLRRSTTHR